MSCGRRSRRSTASRRRSSGATSTSPTPSVRPSYATSPPSPNGSSGSSTTFSVARLEGRWRGPRADRSRSRPPRRGVRCAGTGGRASRFSVQVEPTELTVRADREKLGQVLANLLDNAVRYSPEGGTITVSARGRSHAVEITVADEGLGISEPDQQRVFKFFRSERAPAGQGTGLGLFLVRGLVTAMGGRIWLESEEGRGSRFTVELPGPTRKRPRRLGSRRRRRDPRARHRRRGADPPALPGQPRGGGNGSQRGGRRAGRAAPRPRPAARRHPPRRDDAGPRRLASCRDAPGRSRHPGHSDRLLTARADVRDRARGIDLGGLEYITKPFNPVELACSCGACSVQSSAGHPGKARASRQGCLSCGSSSRASSSNGGAG